MPVVLVHGNPETDAIWDELRAELGRDDVVALSPPGFGAPVPPGFTATSDAYVTWLADALAALGEPIDLVGHDWGGGHVIRLVMAQPQRVRSWAIDVAGCLDPDYVWHDFAQTWQTAEAGEAAIEQRLATPPADRVAQFVSLGMSEAAARSAVQAQDADQGRCILALYRSAAQPKMAEWGRELPRAAARPGLVLIPTADAFTGGEKLARRSAQRAGAKVALLTGLGHWWMCEDPKRGADALRRFLGTVRTD